MYLTGIITIFVLHVGKSEKLFVGSGSGRKPSRQNPQFSVPFCAKCFVHFSRIYLPFFVDIAHPSTPSFCPMKPFHSTHQTPLLGYKIFPPVAAFLHLSRLLFRGNISRNKRLFCLCTHPFLPKIPIKYAERRSYSRLRDRVRTAPACAVYISLPHLSPLGFRCI